MKQSFKRSLSSGFGIPRSCTWKDGGQVDWAVDWERGKEVEEEGARGGKVLFDP